MLVAPSLKFPSLSLHGTEVNMAGRRVLGVHLLHSRVQSGSPIRPAHCPSKNRDSCFQIPEQYLKVAPLTAGKLNSGLRNQ